MRKTLLALSIVAMMLIVAVPAVMADDGQDSNVSYTFTGQIAHGGSKPMESPGVITICVYSVVDGGEIIENTIKTRLNESGYFSIGLDDVNKEKTYITFTETDYTVSGKTSCMEKMPDGSFRINFDKITPKGNEYCLTSDMEYIHMGSAYGAVKGKVVSASGSNPSLNGIKITITSKSGNETHYALTHGDGTFSITDNVGVGTYKLVAEGKGFESYQYEDEVVVTSGETYTVPTIQMTPDNSIDTSHWMTICGIVAAVLLILGTVIHIARVKKKSPNE